MATNRAMLRFFNHLLWIIVLLNCRLVSGAEDLIKDSFLNMPEESAEAAKNDRLLLVLFEQEGCPYCAKLHEVHFRDRQVRPMLMRGFDIVQMDIWGSRDTVDFHGRSVTEKQFARDNRVQFSPTLIFYNGKGDEIYRIWGLHTPEVFAKELEFLHSGAYTKSDFQTFSTQHVGVRGQSAATLEAYDFVLHTRDLKAAAEEIWLRDGFLVVMFESRSCTACLDLRRRHFEHQMTRDLMIRHFKVVSIDVDDMNTLVDLDGVMRAPRQVMERMHVQLVPMMLFFDRSGKEVIRYEGHLRAEHFSSGLLTYLSTHDYQKMPSLQDWLRLKSNEKRELE